MVAPVRKLLKCYVETSVFNWVLALDRGEEQKGTELFLRKCAEGSFEAYISALVLEEIEATSDEDKRVELLRQVNRISPVQLSLEPATLDLADQYVAAGVIPASARQDAVHVALATVNNLDVIVSWNMEHLVRHKTRAGVSSINKLAGYKEIDIVTPREVP